MIVWFVVAAVFLAIFWYLQARKRYVMDPTKSFDQTFAGYTEHYGLPIVKAHQKCKFVRRTLLKCVPQSGIPPPQKGTEQYKKFIDIIDGTRTYLLHVPYGMKCNAKHYEEIRPKSIFYRTKEDAFSGNNSVNLCPLVVIIPGTDEVAIDCELIHHVTAPHNTWLDLSDAEQVVILVAQARGCWSTQTSSWRPPNDYLRTLWIPKCIDTSEFDAHYLGCAVEDAMKVCPSIDPKRIHVIGFSNGGFMACDVALSALSKHRKAKEMVTSNEGENLPTLSFSPASVCLYMGGINGRQMGVTLGIDKYSLPNVNELIALNQKHYTIANKEKQTTLKDIGLDLPRVLIITSTFDPQIFSCMHAFQTLYLLGYPVRLVTLPEKSHEYYPESTKDVWAFFAKV